jgi:hypothetical protein
MVEAILSAAGAEFRGQFESELRQRLMDIATAEIEHIIHEVSGKLHTQMCLELDIRSMTHNLQLHVKVSK